MERTRPRRERGVPRKGNGEYMYPTVETGGRTPTICDLLLSTKFSVSVNPFWCHLCCRRYACMSGPSPCWAFEGMPEGPVCMKAVLSQRKLEDSGGMMKAALPQRKLEESCGDLHRKHGSGALVFGG